MYLQYLKIRYGITGDSTCEDSQLPESNKEYILDSSDIHIEKSESELISQFLDEIIEKAVAKIDQQ